MLAEHTEELKRLQLPEKRVLPDQKLLQSKNSNDEHKQRICRKRSKQRMPTSALLLTRFWNIQYNSLLNLDFKKQTKEIAFADDLLIAMKAESIREAENIINIEMNKILI